MAKADEEAAREKYSMAASASENPAVKEVFEKLAYEEEMHIAVLEQFEKNLKS
jgi:rubrerythrin